MVGLAERRDWRCRTGLLVTIGFLLGRKHRPCTRDEWRNCFRVAGRKRARRIEAAIDLDSDHMRPSNGLSETVGAERPPDF